MLVCKTSNIETVSVSFDVVSAKMEYYFCFRCRNMLLKEASNIKKKKKQV